MPPKVEGRFEIGREVDAVAIFISRRGHNIPRISQRFVVVYEITVLVDPWLLFTSTKMTVYRYVQCTL